MSRGRPSLMSQLQSHLNMNVSGVYQYLNENLAEVPSSAKACEKIAELTDSKVKSTIPPFRNLIKQGVKAGRIRKGTNLYRIANQGRGVPKGTVNNPLGRTGSKKVSSEA